MKFELKEYKPISDDDILEDIRRVAELIGNNTVIYTEYRKHGKYSDKTISRRFGKWNDALQKAGLKETGFNFGISEEDLFADIEQMWIKRGKQPSAGYIKQRIGLFQQSAKRSRASFSRSAHSSLWI